MKLENLRTEQQNQASARLDLETPLEIARIINNEDKKVALAVEQALPQIAEAIDAIADVIRKGGRLIYVGAGTSGRLAALDADVQSELERASQALSGRVRQLAERYASPLPRLTEEVQVLSARVQEHLKKMGVPWN